uniref:Uncharacterized protein n=1 Tax=Anopheles darlingi TaxID=43151 RepID=A0A2M4CN42_ANODA
MQDTFEVNEAINNSFEIEAGPARSKVVGVVQQDVVIELGTKDAEQTKAAPMLDKMQEIEAFGCKVKKTNQILIIFDTAVYRKTKEQNEMKV